MILLNIPQGVVTFASAVLAAIATFVIAAIGFALSLHGRVKVLENDVQRSKPHTDEIPMLAARTEILWDRYRREAPNLTTVGSPENPMKQERWNELAEKLSQDEISYDEAEEFLAALLKREEQARREKDWGTMYILGSGIVLSKWKLKEKELQEQSKEKELREQK